MSHFAAGGHAPALLGQLSAKSFNTRLSIDFEDESTVRFNCAFAVYEGQGKYLVVYTEHNGYHVFMARCVTRTHCEAY
jgi:hypothetical protein